MIGYTNEYLAAYLLKQARYHAIVALHYARSASAERHHTTRYNFRLQAWDAIERSKGALAHRARLRAATSR